MPGTPLSPAVFRILARVCGSAALIFLLWMLIGHFTGDANGPHGMRFNNTQERLAFLAFPVMSMAGLALAYMRPLAGGTLSLVGMACLFLLRPDLLATSITLWAVPGLLYVIAGALGPRRK